MRTGDILLQPALGSKYTRVREVLWVVVDVVAVEGDGETVVDGERAAVEEECCAGGCGADAEADGEEAEGFFDDGVGIGEALELFGVGEEGAWCEGGGGEDGGVFGAEG